MSLTVLKKCGIDAINAAAPQTLQSFYQQNGAPQEIVDLVGLSNKRIGGEVEKLVAAMTGCVKIPDVKGTTGWDLEHKKDRVEVKTSRYWRSGGGYFFKWQHILADHEWSHLILVAIDFTEVKLFFLSKPEFMKLIREGRITQQGGAGGQGCWMTLNNIKDCVKDIAGKTLEDLHHNTSELFAQNPASYEPVSTEDINTALATGQKVRDERSSAKKVEQANKKAAKQAEREMKAYHRLEKKAAKKLEIDARKAATLKRRAEKKAAKQALADLKQAEREMKWYHKSEEKKAKAAAKEEAAREERRSIWMSRKERCFDRHGNQL
jgi:flagellar biosynthesis GTPase FlhF